MGSVRPDRVQVIRQDATKAGGDALDESLGESLIPALRSCRGIRKMIPP
jgi:hypothetical protein